MTLPKYTAPTSEGSMFPCVRAALVAMVPSSVEVSFFSEPPNAPKGVLFAATMKMFVMASYLVV